MSILKKMIERIIYNKSDSYRIRTLLLISLMEVVSLSMFILNIFMGDNVVKLFTGILSFINIVFILWIYITGKFKTVRILFSIICICMITAFLYYGGSDGVAAYWAFLIPFMSCFLYGLWKGCIAASSMLVIAIILLWIPAEPLVAYNYHSTFILRFPILYAMFLIVAIITDYTRVITLRKLEVTIEELNKISNVDTLTGIENRRSFEKRITELWELFATKENSISVLMIDIDYFKQYNDNYGHISGDKVLRQVAQILANVVTTRKGYVSRWGGEEFICLLPFSGIEQSQIVVRDIIEAINKEEIPHEATKLSTKFLTVSVGVATVNDTIGIDPVKVISGADESLYEAKNSGRNRVGSCVTF